MWFFSSQPTRYAGLEIGGSGIKCVILEKQNSRPVLSNYGLVELSGDWVREPEKYNDEILAYLKETIKRLSLTGMAVYSALPTFSVFSSLIRVPHGNTKALSVAVQSEATKFIPLPLEQINLDYKVIESAIPPRKLPNQDLSTFSDAQDKVLLTAAPKAVVARYLQLFKDAQIRLSGLETESFALARAFIGGDQSTVLIADIGSSTSDIVIYEKGIPSFNRTLDLGGKVLTLQVAKQLSLPLEAAEQLKRDIGLAPEPPQGTALEALKSSPLEAIMAPILNEIRYSLQTFEKQRQEKVEKVILTGGTSYVPNLSVRIEKLLGVRTLLGNPWARIVTPPALHAALEEIAPRLAVAAGLALRGFDTEV